MDVPIGIFDSGLGGLTVLREIVRSLPHEDLIYVGDTARVPYGTKSPQTVTRYSLEIGKFLTAQKVKAIIVACNTASSVALEQLRASYSVPIIGVFEPGVQAAIIASKSHFIGVIGTEGTIRSGNYVREIQKRLTQAQVVSRACPLFVPLVEEGWIDHEITKKVIEIYLGDLKASEVDTLILGCTHYPLLKEPIGSILGPRIQLVDSAYETAKVLQKLLHETDSLFVPKRKGQLRFFSTDAPEKFGELASRFLGHSIEKVELAEVSSL